MGQNRCNVNGFYREAAPAVWIRPAINDHIGIEPRSGAGGSVRVSIRTDHLSLRPASPSDHPIISPGRKEMIAERPLKLEEALDIAIQTATGIRAAHEKGIVHRDIKPANVMVNRQGQVKVMDFGLAQLTAAAATQTDLTQPGAVSGTPAYMSPEQAQGQLTDGRADIWALGALLFERLTGRLPFLTRALQNCRPTDDSWHTSATSRAGTRCMCEVSRRVKASGAFRATAGLRRAGDGMARNSSMSRGSSSWPRAPRPGPPFRLGRRRPYSKTGGCGPSIRNTISRPTANGSS